MSTSTFKTIKFNLRHLDRQPADLPRQKRMGLGGSNTHSQQSQIFLSFQIKTTEIVRERHPKISSLRFWVQQLTYFVIVL
jgi:hypothetical protein